MRRIEEVTLLYEISEALNEHLDLRKSLYKVLDILSNLMNMVRGMVTILDPLRNEINIEVAHGISRSAMAHVKYKLGEGITGRVIQTGRGVAIPRISKEPLFLTLLNKIQPTTDDILYTTDKRRLSAEANLLWITRCCEGGNDERLDSNLVRSSQ